MRGVLRQVHIRLRPNGCGWAHFEKKCISGQPDYPSDHTVKLVQWQPPGLCYRVAYNQKKAF